MIVVNQRLFFRVVLLVFIALLLSLLLLALFFHWKLQLPLGYSFWDILIHGVPPETVIIKKILLVMLCILFFSLFLTLGIRKKSFFTLGFVFLSLSGFMMKMAIFNELSEGLKVYSFIYPLEKHFKRRGEEILFSPEKERLIAHAGGGVDGQLYIESLEALNRSYQRGFRFFELDLRKSSDGHYVAVHDWKSWRERTHYAKERTPTLKEFKAYRLKLHYTPLGMREINQWFNNHKDAILVTDKVNTPLAFSQQFIDKKRLRMELFSMESVVRLIPKNRVAVLRALGIEYIVVSYKDFRNKAYQSLFQSFAKNGIKVYLYGQDREAVLKPLYYYGRYL